MARGTRSSGLRLPLTGSRGRVPLALPTVLVVLLPLIRDAGEYTDNARGDRLQAVRGETGVFGDAGKHAGADLFAVVKREDEVRPIGMGENSV